MIAYRFHVKMWRKSNGRLDVLRGAFWEGDSLACTPGSISHRGAGCTFALGFGRLTFSLRGAGVTDKLTQELELGQEELPDYIPTKQHEEQRTDECGHNDQHCEPDTLPHRSWTSGSNNSIRRMRRTGVCSTPHAILWLAVLVESKGSAPRREGQTAGHRRFAAACFASSLASLAASSGLKIDRKSRKSGTLADCSRSQQGKVLLVFATSLQHIFTCAFGPDRRAAT